jgi:iron complex transport system permease protein
MLTIGLAFWTLTLGLYPVSLADVWAATSGNGTDIQQLVVNELRLPRVTAAILVGLALGASGAIFQGLVRNPLVAPDIIGINAGAGLAAMATALVVLAAQVGLNPIVSVTLLASVVRDPAALGVPVPLMAAGLMAGWGLAMVTSPLTASMLMTARLARTSPYTVGYRWNGPFVLVTIALLWLAASAYGALVA